MLVAFTACNNHEVNIPEGDEVIMGIFGGMGPDATADLYQKVVDETPARIDQEHIPTIIFSNTKVPDRTASIEGSDGGKLIKPYLRYSVRKLESAGASFIAIPCNTAHYYFDFMQESVNIPIINMIVETAIEVAKKYPDVKKVGLLATSGTIGTGLYHKELEARGIEVITPDDSIEINMVMKAIYGLKSKTDPQVNEDLITIAGQHLADRGAEIIVLGCTEIPLIYNPARVNLPMVSASKVLLDRSIEMYQTLSGVSWK
jgi:aspartate racemase